MRCVPYVDCVKNSHATVMTPFFMLYKKKKKKKKGLKKDDRNDSEVEALQAKNNETKITETSPEVEAL